MDFLSVVVSWKRASFVPCRTRRPEILEDKTKRKLQLDADTEKSQEKVSTPRGGAGFLEARGSVELAVGTWDGNREGLLLRRAWSV